MGILRHILEAMRSQAHKAHIGSCITAREEITRMGDEATLLHQVTISDEGASRTNFEEALKEFAHDMEDKHA